MIHIDISTYYFRNKCVILCCMYLLMIAGSNSCLAKQQKVSSSSFDTFCRIKSSKHTPNFFPCATFNTIWPSTKEPEIYCTLSGTKTKPLEVLNRFSWNIWQQQIKILSTNQNFINKSKFYQKHEEFPFAFEETMQFTSYKASA